MTSKLVILRHFRNMDPLMYDAMQTLGDLGAIAPAPPAHYFAKLCRSIIGQQLSSKAADTIITRFQGLFSVPYPQPDHVKAIGTDTLRKIGMSTAKAHYVKNLARDIMDGKVSFSEFDQKSDNDIIRELTKVKGIGPWTAEMFLIFTLGRENVFSFGDLGLKKGIRLLYGFDNEPSHLQIERIIAPWTPFRSYACRILWASIDVKSSATAKAQT